MNNLTRLASALTRSSGFEFEVSNQLVRGQQVDCIRPSGLERGRGFSIVPLLALRSSVVSIELDNFARPALEALFDNFRDNRSALLDHISEILGSCESTFYIDGAAFAKPSELPLEVWRNFAFDVREPIDELSDPFTILERVAVKSLAVLLNLLPVETPRPVGVDEETGFPEGASMQVLVNRYERDPRNRSAAIAIHGSTCAVCDFSFEAQYGDTGLGYIEVHHLKPLSTLGANYQINPSTDLVPLCSNCHSMVHRRKPPYTPSELRQKLST